MAGLELTRRQHTERRVSALTVMEDLEILEESGGQLQARGPGCRSRSSTWTRLRNDSITALSKQVPTPPIEGSRPTSWARRVKAHEPYCVPWITMDHGGTSRSPRIRWPCPGRGAWWLLLNFPSSQTRHNVVRLAAYMVRAVVYWGRFTDKARVPSLPMREGTRALSCSTWTATAAIDRQKTFCVRRPPSQDRGRWRGARP